MTTSPYPLKNLLGGLSPERFLAEYWQKKPLLVRQAIPGFQGLLGQAELFDLACRDDAESRLVRTNRGRWTLDHGPFEPATLDSLPRRGWSLLVQGVNHFLPAADRLLHSFSFAPYARLDDLMVSFAPDGGGVGPHFDSYDVFLIQGLGRRRWEISAQTDLELVEDAPLRILKRFQAKQAWELEPGDMLYLPPKYAHNGIALGDCMTYSVGFRAPSSQEIATQFLVYLQDKLALAGRYADPRLKRPRHPAEIGEAMLQQIEAMIAKIRWKRTDIADFAGRYLSEPKAHIFFDPPARPLGLAAFRQQAEKHGLRLDSRTLLLFKGSHFFLNGESLRATPDTAAMLRKLADARRLEATALPDDLADILYAWYRLGYLHPAHR